MEEILTDDSATSVVRAIKANWADYYCYLGRSPRAELRVGPHLSWLLTGVPTDFLNVVWRTQLPSHSAGEMIDAALTHFRSRQVTRLSWWIGEDMRPLDLAPHLAAQGLTFSEGGTGMAADLSAVPQGLPTPTGLTIVPVEDRDTLEEWVHVSRVGFGIPVSSEPLLLDLHADLGFVLPLRSYLARLNGRPVGTSQLFLSAGVAGIYTVACLPDARGQGVGTAITLAPLLEARQLGYRLGILQASHQGYNVYRRLGFRDYGRLGQYVWENHAS